VIKELALKHMIVGEERGRSAMTIKAAAWLQDRGWLRRETK
jgi:hypothetical protein